MWCALSLWSVIAEVCSEKRPAAQEEGLNSKRLTIRAASVYSRRKGEFATSSASRNLVVGY